MSTVQATNLKHGSSATNNIVLDASGNTTISGAATISGNAVVTGTLQANGVTGSVYPLVQGTAVASTSGTAIDFTGIPSWVRRVTVMFNGVSTNGTSPILTQIGAGSVTTTGYLAGASQSNSTATITQVTTGFPIQLTNSAVNLTYGALTLSTLGSNVWVPSGVFWASIGVTYSSSGVLSLGGTLDRIRITTVGGTDTFDAGSINIMFE